MMSKGYTFSVLNRLGRILGIVCILLAANSFAGAQSKLVDDLPTDTRVRIVEPRMHHEVYGTGFVAEIDLSGLPAWTGDLELSAVEWPVSKETVRRHYSDVGYRGTKNPFVAFTVALARIGSMGGASTRDIEPLIPETVFPLSESVVDSGNGKFLFKSLPQDKRVRFLIPHAMVQDSDRVYFMLKADQFKVPVKYFYTPQLFPDTLLPDLKVAFVRSETRRYAGAAGKMITLSYQFPEYLLKLNGEYRGMTPELTLNGRYPVPKAGSSPINWRFVEKAKGLLIFFMPDALYDQKGKAFLDISFKKPKSNSPKVGYGRVELEGEPVIGPMAYLRIKNMKLVKPKFKNYVFQPIEIHVGIGGIIVGSSMPSSRDRSDKTHSIWEDYEMIQSYYRPTDSLQIWIRGETSDMEKILNPDLIDFEDNFVKFYLSRAIVNTNKGTMSVKLKFRFLGLDYYWIPILEYIFPIGE